jgi:hypothetical protein
MLTIRDFTKPTTIAMTEIAMMSLTGETREAEEFTFTAQKITR